MRNVKGIPEGPQLQGVGDNKGNNYKIGIYEPPIKRVRGKSKPRGGKF